MDIVNTQIDHPKKISGLIQEQFPAFYNKEGPVFIEFVKAYYDWMESRSDRRNKLINPNKSTVNVVYGSVNVVGNSTAFTTNFANGDKIAISKEDEDYEIFTIDVVTNTSFMTLTTDKTPTFASGNATYGNVHSNTNPGYYVRRTQDSMDIDRTTDDFVVYFKEQFLKNIQFNTITGTRTLIKNSLDIYRSKGTPRAIDLLFKATFGIPADVYYPSIDLFRTSAADWKIPRYLELSLSPVSRTFVNKQITGLTSEATAFCEEVVRREVNGRLVDLAYISAIQGEWMTGERVVVSGELANREETPTVIGSLNKVIIVDGGSDFSIGNSVTLVSNSGYGAVGRVANTTNTTGSIAVTLLEGGYGYSSLANTFISNNILRISNASVNAGTSDYLLDFEDVVQPYANVLYSAATGTMATGDDVYTYHGNGDVKGTGALLNIIASNSTAGELTMKIISGDMDEPTFYTTSNAISATSDTYTDKTATAKVLGEYANVVLQVNTIVGSFTLNEQLTGSTQGNGLFYTLSNTSGVNASIRVSNGTFAYLPGDTVTGATSGATAVIREIDIEVGVINVSSDFITTSNNFFYSNTRSVNGEITLVSTGSGMTLSPANNFLYTEYANVCTTLLSANGTHYLPIGLDAAAYALPGDVACNLTSNTIENALSYSNLQIGKIQTLTSVSPGSNYNRAPIVRILDYPTAGLGKRDTKYLTITGATTDFTVGEVVTQADNSFRGLVETANSTYLTVQRMRIFDANDAVLTTNSTTTIVGDSSGAEANVTIISTSVSDDVIGYDAEIGISTSVANGVITEIDVTDSGFGFKDGQALTIGNLEAVGIANVYTYGTGAGFWRSKDGFLSDVKVLQDGKFWQTHSYEVRASVAIDKYSEMLKQVVHVSGTQYFGNLVLSSTSNSFINAISNTVTGTNTVIIT